MAFVFFGKVQAQDISSFSISLDHIALSVKDVDRAAEFYKTIMKLPEIENKAKIDGIRWFRLADGRELHLISVIKENVIMNKALHLGLTTANFKTFVAYLEDKKITYYDWPGKVNTVNIRADGVKQIFFQDPDGYWLEVNSSLQK